MTNQLKAIKRRFIRDICRNFCVARYYKTGATVHRRHYDNIILAGEGGKCAKLKIIRRLACYTNTLWDLLAWCE